MTAGTGELREEDQGHGSGPGPAGILGDRDFRLLWVGETTSKLGSSVSAIAVPLVAIAVLHASVFQVSALTALTWLPWLLIGLPAGAWVDRLPGRRVMLVCNLVSTLAFVSVPLAAWAGMLTIGQLMLAALLAGSAAVFFETAYQVYLPSLVDPGRLTEANARLQSGAAAAGVLGPGVGGLIAQAVGAVAGPLADAVSFVVSSLCLLAIRGSGEPVESARRTTRLRQEITEGLRFVGRDPYLRVMTISGAVANLALMGYQALLMVFMVRVIGISAGTAGVLAACAQIGAVFGAVGATLVTRRFGSARGFLVAQSFGAFALLIPLGGRGARLAFLLVGALLVAFGVVMAAVIKASFRQAYCPRPMLGRVTVSMQFLNYGSIPLGALLGGVLSGALGVRPTMWIMTAAFALSVTILLFSPIPGRRDLPSAPPDLP